MDYNLFDEYSQYLALMSITITMTKNKMIALLREHGIDYTKSNGTIFCSVSNEDLRNFGKKFRWFFKDDEEEHNENRTVKTDEVKSKYVKIRRAEYENLKKEFCIDAFNKKSTGQRKKYRH